MEMLFHQTTPRLKQFIWGRCCKAFQQCQKNLHTAAPLLQEQPRLNNSQRENNVLPFESVPERKGNRLISIIRQLKSVKQQHILTVELEKELGPISKFESGPVKFVFLSALEGIESLFRQESKYPSRIQVESWNAQWDALGQTYGLLLSENEQWLKMRRGTNKVMLKTQIVASTAKRNNEVSKRFVSYISSKRDSEDILDINYYIYKWSIENIGSVLFEKDIGLLTDASDIQAEKLISAVQNVFLTTSYLFFLPLKAAKILLPGTYRKQYESFKTMFEIASQYIDERMQTPEGELDVANPGLLTYLLQHMGDKDDQMNMKEFYATVIELFTAAIDTSSNTIIFALNELSRHPEVVDEIYKEITCATQEDDVVVTSQLLQKTPLLRAVVNETLRMFPVIQSVSRIIKEDTVLMNYRIPAGVCVVIPLYNLGRNSNFFKDPDTFKPERWLRGADGKRDFNPFAYLPFGMGSRSCIGRRLAELEMHTLLFHIIRKFKIESVDNKPIEVQTRLLLTPKDTIRLKLIDR